MKVLVTGAAGFIGMHVCQLLLARGDTVLGIDNLNNYYDPALKRARLDRLQKHSGFQFQKIDIADRAGMDALFASAGVSGVVHLAAQAGVRYSLENPAAFIDSNLVGFGNMLEGCRKSGVKHLVYASSSSVYGGNRALPFSEHHSVDHPVSLYAATKKANELMAHSYSHLHRMPTTGLRFFTVYGPWGRPDMALFLFTKAILAGEPIKVFNHGAMNRDFTYIDDIAESVVRVLDKPAAADPAYDAMHPDAARSDAPYRVFNVGNNSPVSLMAYIEAVEEALGRKATKEFMPLQPGDVPDTAADASELREWTAFSPSTPVSVGVANFVAWYLEHYRGSSPSA